MIPGASLSLSISQQFAKIGIDIQRGRLEMRSQPADLSIVQTPAKLQVDSGPGTLSVDGEDAHSALGHKPTERMNRDIAAQMRGLVLEVIGEIAAEGDRLMKIENGVTTTIADIAKEKSQMGPAPIEYNGPFVNNPVRVDYTPYPLQIEWTLGGADIQVTPHPVEITFTPGKVMTYVKQQYSLEIDVKGQYLNMTF